MKPKSTQHDLMVRVLEAAGGQAIESLAPAGYKGSIADILFADEDVVVEVKSLTTDRATAANTMAAIKAVFAENRALGAPDPETTESFRLHDLPEIIAIKVLRIVGKRVQTEIVRANKQIRATKALLQRPDAIGVLAVITPPSTLDRNSVIWLTGDGFRNGECSSVNVLFLVETPLGHPTDGLDTKASFLSPHSRGGRVLPAQLLTAIFEAWGRVTGQEGRDADSNDFHKLGATS